MWDLSLLFMAFRAAYVAVAIRGVVHESFDKLRKRLAVMDQRLSDLESTEKILVERANDFALMDSIETRLALIEPKRGSTPTPPAVISESAWRARFG